MSETKRFRNDGLETIVFTNTITLDLSEFNDQQASDIVDTLSYKLKKTLINELTHSEWRVVSKSEMN